MFRDSFQDAFDANYQGLTGSTRYNVDYSILGTSEDEPLMRDIRNAMYGAGLTVESSKGECNFGQHEIAFRYDEVLRTADNHVVFKAAAKELAAKHGKSPDLHGQVRRARGQLVPRAHEPAGHGRRDRVRRRRRRQRRPQPGLLELRRRRSRDPARVHPALRAERELLQALPARVVRPDRRRVGRGQPDLRPAGRRARPRAAGGEPGAGRRRQPLPGAGRDARRRVCTGSATSWSWSPPSPATPTRPTPPASRARCAPRATCSRRPSWPRRRSARTWSRTTCGPRTSSSRPSRPR